MDCDNVECEQPPARGACCLEDGRCKEALTEEECADTGGIEWHDGLACDAVECPQPGGCNGNVVIAKAKCKTKRGAVKKAIVLIKNATPGDDYPASLDTGQQLTKQAKGSGKAKFTFKGGNKPPCGANAVKPSAPVARAASRRQ